MSVIGIKQKLINYACCMGILTKQRQNVEEIMNGKLLNYNLLKDVCLRVSSTNNIIEFFHDNKKYFFRECKIRVPKGKLIDTIILDWINMVEAPHCNIKAKLVDNNLFINMGIMNDVDSNLYKYFKYNKPEIVGFDASVIDMVGKPYFNSFIHYAWSELLTWKMNAGANILQMASANRMLCQEKIYRLFNVDRLVCHTEPVTIVGKSAHKGIMVHNAQGVNPIKLGESYKQQATTPSLHRELTILNVMDALCYERDHRPGNYNVILDDNDKMVSIQAFDNDSILTFLPIGSVSKSFVGSKPLVDKKNKFTRAHLDKEFAIRFISINEEQLISVSDSYLNRAQQKALVIRFHNLKNAIELRMAADGNFLVSKENWTQSIVDDDIKVGASYYTTLLDWQEQEKDPILLAQGTFPAINIIL